MQYHVAKNGEKTGPFEKEEVNRRLVAGELSGSDLGWHEGLTEWEPLAKLLPPQAPPIPTAGTPVFGSISTPAQMSPQSAQTSGMAIASMICGILGLLLWLPCIPAIILGMMKAAALMMILWLPCIPAIILGHLGLSAIKKSAGALKGGGMAVAGLVMGYLMIAAIPLIAILAAIAIPAFSSIQEKAVQAKTMSNARQLALAVKMYAQEHEGNLPPSLEKMVEENIVDQALLAQRPESSRTGDYGQGWDYRGAGMKDTEAGQTVILVSVKADRAKKKIVGHLDGTVELVPESEIP